VFRQSWPIGGDVVLGVLRGRGLAIRRCRPSPASNALLRWRSMASPDISTTGLLGCLTDKGGTHVIVQHRDPAASRDVFGVAAQPLIFPASNTLSNIRGFWLANWFKTATPTRLPNCTIA